MTSTSTLRARRREASEERLDSIFQALSNRTRRAMLRRLRRAPANVTELAAPFDMSLPAASKHVRVLERAGLVARAVEGRVHHLAFDPAPLEEAERFIAHYRAFWEDTLEGLADFAEREAPK